MARNRSEQHGEVIAQKVWMPTDRETDYRWGKDRGGSRAFLCKVAKGEKACGGEGLPNGHSLPAYAICFQNHKAYVQCTSSRYFQTLADAQEVWALLDTRPRIDAVPKGVHFEVIGNINGGLGVEAAWDGMTYPNGTVGPWDPNPDGTYPDFPTPYDGEADTYC